MHNYYPILWVGAIIGVISTLLIVAAFVVKDGEKETGFERNMKDSEIMQRLMDYAKPFYRQFIVVGFLMLFSIAYDIISPLIVGKIEELVVGKFALNTLFLWVAGYAAILLVSMACTYFQAVILQKTGQKIISNMREDLFVHIERLSHEQVNEIPRQLFEMPILLPVWTLTYPGKDGKVYYYAMNGQTGTINGDFPYERKRALLTSAVSALLVLIVMLIGGYFA